MPKTFRIFLSSPGDVSEERALALKVIKKLDNDESVLGAKISLEAVAWDKPGQNAPLLATVTPQEAINEGLPKPSECDVVIVIFWSRMGTPLPENYTKPDGSRFRSGTEWEYEDALKTARESGKPAILVYRRTEEVLLNPADSEFLGKYEQWQQVQDFFRQFVADDGSILQGYNSYEDAKDFGKQLEHHLKSILVRLVKQTNTTTAKIVEEDLPILDEILEENEDVRLLHQLRLAVRLWEENERSEDYLWVGKQLQDAQELVTRLEATLDDSERAFLEPEHERLLAEIQDPDTPHYQRALIGERLNQLGDIRLGVSLREDGLPDFMWREVPAGKISLQTESSKFDFAVKPFRIAQYPVTYGQYRAFMESPDGYANAQWWEGLGRHGEMPSQTRPFDNHPVELVSWYDAMAFCRWATVQLGHEIRLPTEWEWQQAASGGKTKFTYPWGTTWKDDFVNTRDSNLLRTVAVGMYPHNASPIGAMDMIGNVWEWCINELEMPTNISLPNKKKRALRGCSCLSRQRKTNIGYRAGNFPNRRAEAHGFRVCAP